MSDVDFNFLCGWQRWMCIIDRNVGVRAWSCLNGRESTSEYVCVGAHIHVCVGVREWIWLSVLESACESV